jgi:hypothetical protein
MMFAQNVTIQLLTFAATKKILHWSSLIPLILRGSNAFSEENSKGWAGKDEQEQDSADAAANLPLTCQKGISCDILCRKSSFRKETRSVTGTLPHPTLPLPAFARSSRKCWTCGDRLCSQHFDLFHTPYVCTVLRVVPRF